MDQPSFYKLYKKYKRKYKGGAAQAAQMPLEWEDRKELVLELINMAFPYKVMKYKGNPTEPAEYTADFTSEDLEGRHKSKCVGESDFSAGCYIEQCFEQHYNPYGNPTGNVNVLSKSELELVEPDTSE